MCLFDLMREQLPLYTQQDARPTLGLCSFMCGYCPYQPKAGERLRNPLGARVSAVHHHKLILLRGLTGEPCNMSVLFSWRVVFSPITYIH